MYMYYHISCYAHVEAGNGLNQNFGGYCTTGLGQGIGTKVSSGCGSNAPWQRVFVYR